MDRSQRDVMWVGWLVGWLVGWWCEWVGEGPPKCVLQPHSACVQRCVKRHRRTTGNVRVLLRTTLCMHVTFLRNNVKTQHAMPRPTPSPPTHKRKTALTDCLFMQIQTTTPHAVSVRVVERLGKNRCSNSKIKSNGVSNRSIVRACTFRHITWGTQTLRRIDVP